MTLKHKYRHILIGFEKYSFSEQTINAFDPEFEMVLNDRDACQNCDGKVCRSWLNQDCSDWYRHLKTRQEKCNNNCYPQASRKYYALWHKGSTTNKPSFAVFRCPGTAERKEQIVAAMTSLIKDSYAKQQHRSAPLSNGSAWQNNAEQKQGEVPRVHHHQMEN